MTAMLETPRELVQSFAELRLPAKTDARLQQLMDRNTEGHLTPQERDDLEALVELGEHISLLRAQTLTSSGASTDMTLTWSEIVRRVIARAAGRCEYCRMHQSLQGATFHVEHIIPRSRSGTDDETNLCSACPSCNLHKSSRTGYFDPETGEDVELFHPRRERWADHFEWHGFSIHGLTPTGRGTILALELNAPRRQLIREAEAIFELFPPEGQR